MEVVGGGGDCLAEWGLGWWVIGVIVCVGWWCEPHHPQGGMMGLSQNVVEVNERGRCGYSGGVIECGVVARGYWGGFL